MVELNPYVRSQLYRSRTGTTLLNRLETSRSVSGGSGGSVHPVGFVGPTVQEANIVSSKPPSTVSQNETFRPINYTTGAYQQYTSSQLEKASSTRSQIRQFTEYDFSQVKNKRLYPVYFGGREVLMPGNVASNLLSMEQKRAENIFLPLATKYEKQAEQINVQAMGLQPYHKIREVEPGKFTIQTDPMAKARMEWKTLSPVQQFGRAFWVGATQWPRTVWGGFLNPKQLQKELITTEQYQWEGAKKYGAGFVVKEAAVSPAMVDVYITLGTMGVVKAGSLAARGAARYVPRFVSKTSEVFPKTSIFSRSLSKISQRPVMQNYYRWAVKGYVPGSALVQVPKGEPYYSKGIRFQRYVFKPDKSLGFFNRRVWLSPQEQLVYKNLMRSSGRSFITLGVRGESGVGETFGIFEKNVYKKGMFSPLKSRLFASKTSFGKVGVEVGKSSDDISRGLGSFYRNMDDVVRPVVDVGRTGPVGKGVWGRDVESMWRYGYPYRFNTLESGMQIVDWAEGFGGSSFSPTPKTWINKIRSGLVYSREAAGSLLKRPVQVFKRPSSTLGNVFNMLQPRTLVPASEGFGSGFFVPVMGFKSDVDMNKIMVGNVNQVKVPMVNFRTDMVLGVSHVSKTFKDVVRVPEAVSMQKVFSPQVEKVVTRSVTKVEEPYLSGPVFPFVSSVGFPLPLIPGLYGGGGGGSFLGFGRGKRYGFREFRVDKLFENL